MRPRPARLVAAALALAIVAGFAGWALGGAKPGAPSAGADRHAAWLRGTTEERFAAIERHLRGLDQAMAEIGYRYGELVVAAKDRNWDYAKYQAEKMRLTLELAVERRPKRAASSRPFLEEAIPGVLRAAEAKEAAALDSAMDRLQASCVE
jgi:hypothetical protein